jgi:hypothetical protein
MHPIQQERAIPSLLFTKRKSIKTLLSCISVKQTSLLDKITVLSYDELYGDVKSTFSYRDYSKNNALYLIRPLFILKK